MNEMKDQAPESRLAVEVSSNTLRRARLPVKDWPIDYFVYGGCGLLVVGLLLYAGNRGWHTLEFRDVSIPGIFGSMLLVSLFVERMIEVFVSVWIDRDSAAHEQSLDFWQARQGQLTKEIQALIAERNGTPAPGDTRLAVIDDLLAKKRASVEEAVNFADVETKALLPFSARTLKMSTWIGLLIGVVASAVGFRFLGQLVSVQKNDMLLGQYEAFVAADILLTGAVLAGGSKLIHDMFSVYSSFMDSTKKSLSDQSKNQ